MLTKDQSSILLFVGTELTEGKVRDAYLKYFGSFLKARGLKVSRGVFVPDYPGIMKRELLRGVEESSFVIITGGLGPTSDDLTTEVVASVGNIPLEFDSSVWQAIVRRFEGRELPESNRKQAMIPQGFRVIPNSRGTAPGFFGKIESTLVAVFPGPPGELFPMVEEFLEGILSEVLGINVLENEFSGSAFNISESVLEKGLKDVACAGVTWQTRLEWDRILFTLKGNEGVRESFLRLQADYGLNRIKAGSDSLALRVVELLKREHKKLALAESCTGGMIGEMITGIPGSSEIFPGGIVSYSNEVKSSLLGVSAKTLSLYGAVSGETVEEMVQGALECFEADYSIAVSGVAGPGGGSEEKPVGTVWIGIGMKEKTLLKKRFFFHGDRNQVRRKTAITACLCLEGLILGNDLLDINNEW